MAPSVSPEGYPLGVPQGLRTVNLADHGLSPGDDLAPYFRQYGGDGIDLVFPAEEYRLSDYSEAFGPGSGTGAIRAIPSSYGYMADIRNATEPVRHSHRNGKWYSGNMRMVNGNDDRIQFDIAGGADLECNFIHIPNASRDGSRGDVKGFRTARSHAGHLTLRNCLATKCLDGFYGGSQGKKTNSGGGSSWVMGGYFANSGSSNVRLGSDNDGAWHVTCVCDDPLGGGWGNIKLYRVRESGRNIRFVDCHAYSLDVADAATQFTIDDNIEGCDGDTFVEDCVFYSEGPPMVDYQCGGYDLSGRNNHFSGPANPGDIGHFSNNTVGSGARMPRTEPVWVDADGNVYTGPPGIGGGEPPEPECDGNNDCAENEVCQDGFCVQVQQGGIVEIIAGTGVVEYRFDVDGKVYRWESSSDISSIGEANVTITDNGDGTFTVVGLTGNNFGDAFDVVGTITSFEQFAGDGPHTLIVNGEDMTGATPPINVTDPVDPGDIEVEGISVAPSPMVGTTSTITVTARNVGSERVSETMNVLVNGAVVGSVSFDLEPSVPGTSTVNWTPNTAGQNVIEVGGVTQTVTVGSSDGGGGGDGPVIEAGLGSIVLIGGAAYVAYRYFKD